MANGIIRLTLNPIISNVMYVIYHDPGCVYSLLCLAVLRSKKVNYKKIKYLKEPLTSIAIKELLTKLNISAKDLVRKDHPEWIFFYEDLQLTDDEIIHLMLENHGLIERPIIVSGDKAVIGRPPKKLVQLINQNNNRALNKVNGNSVFS